MRVCSCDNDQVRSVLRIAKLQLQIRSPQETQKSLKDRILGVKTFLIGRLNSGIKNRNNFFVRAFFYFQKIGTDLVYQADSRDIKILVQFPGKSILKLRGLRPYAQAFYSQNHQMCTPFYGGHFDIFDEWFLLDFTSTYAISTPVIFNFSSVFHSKPHLHHRPPP